jgi:hypothetical protein
VRLYYVCDHHKVHYHLELIIILHHEWSLHDLGLDRILFSINYVTLYSVYCELSVDNRNSSIQFRRTETLTPLHICMYHINILSLHTTSTTQISHAHTYM